MSDPQNAAPAVLRCSSEFTIIEKIAQGGMGAVYKASQKGVEGFEKTVAIKTLLNSLSADVKTVEMFICEAKLVANLVHENIVQIYQFGRQGGNYFFVMEYVDGTSLYDFLTIHSKINKTIPRELAVFIASRVARGLAYAHARKDHEGNPLNIVHCDVCPHNVLFTTEGVPKLADFGIAKAATMAKSEAIAGKLPYMSPEQANKGAIDFRSDIYSLGVVLFNLLSGNLTRNVFLPLKELLAQVKTGYVAWEKLPKDLDPELRGMLEKMLAPDPADRYSSTDKLGRDLEYHIYKDGYGPTIVALAEYIRKLMPNLASIPRRSGPPEGADGSTVVLDPLGGATH